MPVYNPILYLHSIENNNDIFSSVSKTTPIDDREIKRSFFFVRRYFSPFRMSILLRDKQFNSRIYLLWKETLSFSIYRINYLFLIYLICYEISKKIRRLFKFASREWIILFLSLFLLLSSRLLYIPVKRKNFFTEEEKE